MAYLALARRYRPRTFAEVVGQEHVVRALSNALEQGRLHHAWLFSGTRGVGKTSIARILARCLNCERGVSAHPCGECGSCRAILAGHFVDLVEVDAASRTRVEETRGLLEGVPYAPAAGRYKVYLIDEVHMLSASSFNALLKTLEEPPGHVKFLFATTEPEKVPLTVRSRCLSFALQRLPANEIETTLSAIVEKEGLEAEPAALAALARAARGSVRDGLSLLDQALAFGGGALSEAEVAALLGTADRDAVYGLLDWLAAGDGKKLLAELGDALRGSNRPEDILTALSEALALIARCQLVADAPLPGGVPRERLQALAGALEPETVQLDYDIAVRGQFDLIRAPDPALGLEMVLLRMLAFRPQASAPPAGATGGAKSREAGNPDAPPLPRTATGKPSHSAERTDLPEDAGWEAIVARLEVDGLTRQLARQCTLRECSGGRVRLALDGKHKHLLTARLEKTLQVALSGALGGACKLDIAITNDASRQTPAARHSAREAERQEQAERSIAQDPHVAALRRTFDAEVIPNTIRPEN